MTAVRRPMLAALLAAVVLAGCATYAPPKPMAPIEDTIEVSATVEAIDVANRLLTLRPPSGDPVTVEVDQAVQNLAQIRVGDRVVVRYHEAIGAEIRPDAAGQPISIDVDGDKARPGQRPSARASATTNVPVTIISVDANRHLVSFAGPDGLVRALDVETPQGREFIKQLKKGDTVVVSFTEALAISVEPVK